MSDTRTQEEKEEMIARLRAQIAEIEASFGRGPKEPVSPVPGDPLKPGETRMSDGPFPESRRDRGNLVSEEEGPLGNKARKAERKARKAERKARKAEEKRMSAPDPREARYEASLAEQAKEQEAEDAEAEMEAAKEKAKDALPSRDQAAKDRMLAGLKEGSPTALDNPAGEEPDVAFNPEMAEEMSGDPGDLEMQLFKTAHGGNFDPKSSMDRNKMEKLKKLLLSGQSFGDLTKEENQERFALKLYRQ